MKIVLCVPTRHRQHRIIEMLTSVDATVRDKHNIQVAIYVDDDDNLTDSNAISKLFPDLNLYFHIGSRTDGASRYNILYNQTDGDIYGYFADDVIFTNRNWDFSVRNLFGQYADRILLVAASNAHSKKPEVKKATHGFVSNESVKIVGSLFPVDFIEFFHDSWLTDVYKPLGRMTTAATVPIVHNSMRLNRSLKDAIYQRGDVVMSNGKTVMENMSILYNSPEKIQERQRWINLLREKMICT